ncbi:MAG: type 1 glutamine amidotransferase [Magnetospirillum sp.]|nr:type 1 glutamine amidotransferase [Magnetospirillum sp.]
MTGKLEGKRVAILATDGFEQSELVEPRKALEGEGAIVDVVSPHDGRIQGMRHHDKAEATPVSRTLADARAEEYDALVLPGGVASPDTLRMDSRAVGFARAFFADGKPVAAICHGPWTLVEAGVVRGRTLTSWPSLQTDIRNAGGSWVDQPVVSDNGLVTSRKPADLAQFCAAMIAEFARPPHGPRPAP